MSDSENTRRLVLAIIDFLQNQLTTRNDLSLEDRESLEIAMECLILAYDVENTDYIQRRPLLDMFMQVANPVSIQNKMEAESHKMSGNAKMIQEQYSEAEEEYSRAIQLDQWNAVYYCNRASARIKLEHFFEAISDCRQALLLNPDYAKAYARMGQAYALMNRHRRAARCYRQALELEPDNERYQNNLRVAESQAAAQPNMDMGNLIQSMVSSLLLGGSPMPVSSGMAGPGPSFVIVGDPHTEDQCSANHSTNDTSESSATNNQTAEDNKQSTGKQEGNETSERRGEDEPLHLRVLFGIPVVSYGEDSSEHSGSMEPQTAGQQGNITDQNQNGAQNTDYNKAQNEVEAKKDIADESQQEESSKFPERKEEPDSTSADGQSPQQGSSKDQATSKDKTEKNIMPIFGQVIQNTLFGKADNSATNGTNHSMKQHLGRQQNNPNLTKTEERGQSSTSERGYLFKTPEGDTRQRQQSAGISMADIANFFRNIASSDRQNANQHNGSQLKASSSKENEKSNDQNKDKYQQGHVSSTQEKQPDILTLPENTPSNEKEENTKTEIDSSGSDDKQETDEISEGSNKSKAHEEDNKDK
ncbi:Small glutamine-rich tetratricopeptide like protein [Argiope bruennichi]|uniref:Small glutamine-rich tetratricopeptide like protein n=1 Tax=Argiope bruennichi TaxID=94029 RepID=A0A8T0EDW6_ARGBR|nr:Small glutamine-rich tetratricopeptide like protein [Argiope bruennichi]